MIRLVCALVLTIAVLTHFADARTNPRKPEATCKGGSYVLDDKDLKVTGFDRKLAVFWQAAEATRSSLGVKAAIKSYVLNCMREKDARWATKMGGSMSLSEDQAVLDLKPENVFGIFVADTFLRNNETELARAGREVVCTIATGMANNEMPQATRQVTKQVAECMRKEALRVGDDDYARELADRFGIK